MHNRQTTHGARRCDGRLDWHVSLKDTILLQAPSKTPQRVRFLFCFSDLYQLLLLLLTTTSFSGHKGAVWSARIDPTGNLAATAGGDFSVKLWDAITGAELRTWSHAHIVKAVAFCPSSRWLATGGHEGLVRLYDLTAASSDANTVGSDEPVVQIVQEPLPDSKKQSAVVITELEWQSETRLWVGCSDGTLRLWQVPAAPDTDGEQPPKLIQTLLTTAAEIRDVEIRRNLPDGTTRMTVAAGNAVYFYQYDAAGDTWKFLKSITTPVHFTEEGGVSLHPAGHVFAVGGSALWVHVFDYETEQELDCLKGHHGPIRCVRYVEPDGNLFATGSEDGTIRLWKNQYPPPGTST